MEPESGVPLAESSSLSEDVVGPMTTFLALSVRGDEMLATGRRVGGGGGGTGFRGFRWGDR